MKNPLRDLSLNGINAYDMREDRYDEMLLRNAIPLSAAVFRRIRQIPAAAVIFQNVRNLSDVAFGESLRMKKLFPIGS